MALAKALCAATIDGVGIRSASLARGLILVLEGARISRGSRVALSNDTSKRHDRPVRFIELRVVRAWKGWGENKRVMRV
ncbi:hypothetical protein JP74_19000 [Devosia sp. 17-2-E-8]|nr:hypothetical protein JP74_19000 [Devosia sp. 17-2-E-8]